MNGVSYIEREKDMQTGSNGFALAQQNSFRNAILYINPILLISDLKYR
jgi:hypothetical protein